MLFTLPFRLLLLLPPSYRVWRPLANSTILADRARFVFIPALAGSVGPVGLAGRARPASRPVILGGGGSSSLRVKFVCESSPAPAVDLVHGRRRRWGRDERLVVRPSKRRPLGSASLSECARWCQRSRRGGEEGKRKGVGTGEGAEYCGCSGRVSFLSLFLFLFQAPGAHLCDMGRAAVPGRLEEDEVEGLGRWRQGLNRECGEEADRKILYALVRHFAPHATRPAWLHV